MNINYDRKIFKTTSIEINEGDLITIDGSTGRIIKGEVTKVKPEISGEFSKVIQSKLFTATNISYLSKIMTCKVR